MRVSPLLLLSIFIPAACGGDSPTDPGGGGGTPTTAMVATAGTPQAKLAGSASDVMSVKVTSGGAPVANALVQISDSCTGELLAKGATDHTGGLNVPAALPDPESYGNCKSDSAPHPLIVARIVGRRYSSTRKLWPVQIVRSPVSTVRS
jgi:hypothetical protein